MTRMIVALVGVAMIAAGTNAAAAAALIGPERADAILAASCREYMKLQHGQRGDALKAQACKAFVTGYVLGWETRQNTPADALPQRVCASGKVDSVIATYLAAEQGQGGQFPPTMALMGVMALKFPCPG